MKATNESNIPQTAQAIDQLAERVRTTPGLWLKLINELGKPKAVSGTAREDADPQTIISLTSFASVIAEAMLREAGPLLSETMFKIGEGIGMGILGQEFFDNIR